MNQREGGFHNSQSHESRGTRKQKGLCWRGPAAIYSTRNQWEKSGRESGEWSE
jgi:hypothetical protein